MLIRFLSSILAQDCAPPDIVANAKSSNLFSPEQEMIFGGLTIQNMAGEIRFVRDEKFWLTSTRSARGSQTSAADRPQDSSFTL